MLFAKIVLMFYCCSKIHYASTNNAQHVDSPANYFITVIGHPLLSGDANIDSQHMLGVSKREKISDTEIVSHHQSRVAHMRYNDGR